MSPHCCTFHLHSIAIIYLCVPEGGKFAFLIYLPNGFSRQFKAKRSVWTFSDSRAEPDTLIGTLGTDWKICLQS